MPTASGLSEYDYPSLTTLSAGLKNLSQIETINKVPIPPEVMEHFKRKFRLQKIFVFFVKKLCNFLIQNIHYYLDIKCHCMMGLFPEIGRAWLTIDSDIYVSKCTQLFMSYILPKFVIILFAFRFGHMSIHVTLLITMV